MSDYEKLAEARELFRIAGVPASQALLQGVAGIQSRTERIRAVNALRNVAGRGTTGKKQNCDDLLRTELRDWRP
jgi:hypothetical protein